MLAGPPGPAEDQPPPSASQRRSFEPLRDLKPEEFGIHYLQEEIRWHRQAGRTISYFVIGLVASLAAYIAAYTYRNPVDFSGTWPQLVPVGLLVIVATVGWLYFRKYYREISFLKSAAQSLILHRIENPEMRSRFSLFAERPREPRKVDVRTLGLSPEVAFERVTAVLNRASYSPEKTPTIAKRLSATPPGKEEYWVEVTVLPDPGVPDSKGSQVFVGVGSSHWLLRRFRLKGIDAAARAILRDVITLIEPELPRLP